VIKRMLTGRWRGSGQQDLDLDACLRILREWAWSAAARDPVSGTGAWTDEFAAPRVPNPADRVALDHVAVPCGPADPDTGRTPRRFVHRSVHEHLVAECVASLTADEAAGELVSHLWYDPDWEYAAPSALALHPMRDQVLGDLVRRATGSDQFAAGFSEFDGCWEFRKFLARVARESAQTDWSAPAAEFIDRARKDLAASRDGGYLVPADDWPTSHRQLVGILLAGLRGANHTTAIAAVETMVCALAEMNPDAGDLECAREAVFRVVSAPRPVDEIRRVARLVGLLDPSDADRSRALQALLDLYRDNPMLANNINQEDLVGLIKTVEEAIWEKERMLGLLTQARNGDAIRELVELIRSLSPDAQECRRARSILLDWLSPLSPRIFEWEGVGIYLSWLEPTDGERAIALKSILKCIEKEKGSFNPDRIAEAIIALVRTDEELAQARGFILAALTNQRSIFQAFNVFNFAQVIERLDPGAAELEQMRTEVIAVTARDCGSVSPRMAEFLARLRPDPSDLLSITAMLARESASADDLKMTQLLAEAGAVLASDAAQREMFRIRALDALMRAMEQEPERTFSPTWTRIGAGEIRSDVIRLAVTAEERARARHLMIKRLAVPSDSVVPTYGLPATIIKLAVSEPEKADVRAKFLRLLPDVRNNYLAKRMSEIACQLNPEAAELSDSIRRLNPPPAVMLAALRARLPLSAWLAELPRLKTAATG